MAIVAEGDRSRVYLTPTSRQLVALTTFSDLVQEAHEKVKADAVAGHRVVVEGISSSTARHKY